MNPIINKILKKKNRTKDDIMTFFIEKSCDDIIKSESKWFHDVIECGIDKNRWKRKLISTDDFLKKHKDHLWKSGCIFYRGETYKATIARFTSRVFRFQKKFNLNWDLWNIWEKDRIKQRDI